MKPNYSVHDDRPPWIRREDDAMVCALHCRQSRWCSNRFGRACKRLGGEQIPKMMERRS